MTLADFKSTLDASGQPLTYRQEDALIRIMYQERRNYPNLRALDGEHGLSQATAARADAILREFDEAKLRILSRAAGVLAPDQLEVFRRHVDEMRDTFELGLTVRSGMMSED